MKKESIELFDRIFTKMMEKTSSTLLDNKKITVEDYSKAIVAAAEHVALFIRMLGMEESAKIDMCFNPITERLNFKIAYYYPGLREIVVDHYALQSFVNSSFALVGDDDFLSDIMGVDNYIDIIENGNILVLQGIAENEGIEIDNIIPDVMDLLQIMLGK